MKVDHLRLRRSSTSFGFRSSRPRRLAIVLGLLGALTVLTVSAAATCNFLLKWGASGNGSGQFTTQLVVVLNDGSIHRADFKFK